MWRRQRLTAGFATLLCVGVLALLPLGCGASSPHVESSAHSTAVVSRLPRPALAIPKGARWLVLAEPRRLLETPALRRVFDVLMPPERLAKWSERYVIDPTTVDAAALAGYPSGELLVAHGEFDAANVVRASTDAMDATETASEEPRPLGIGLIGEGRYLLAGEGDSLVVGHGAPEGWTALFRYLDGATDDPGSALSDAIHRDLAATQQAPLVFHMLEPLGLPLETPIGLVLAGEQQVSVTLSSSDPDQLSVWVALSGEFPDTIEDNLRAFIGALAHEPLGEALGLAAAFETLRVQRADGLVTLYAVLPTERVVRGLRTLFAVDLRDLFQVP